MKIIEPKFLFFLFCIFAFAFSWCNGFNDTESITCSNHGSCNTTLDECECNENYFGAYCEVWECFGILSNNTDSSMICGGMGNCSDINTCSCEEGYLEPNCTTWNCNGTISTDNSTCSSHGNCVAPESCECEDNFYGDNCEFQLFECFGILSNDEKVCGGNGNCSETDTCICNSGYIEPNCTTWYCNGTLNTLTLEDLQLNNSTVNQTNIDELLPCNNRGKCTSPEFCVCDYSYEGDFCSEQRNLILLFIEDNWFLVTLAGIVGVLALIVIPLLFLERLHSIILKKIEKKKKKEEVHHEIILDDEEIDKNTKKTKKRKKESKKKSKIKKEDKKTENIEDSEEEIGEKEEKVETEEKEESNDSSELSEDSEED